MATNAARAPTVASLCTIESGVCVGLGSEENEVVEKTKPGRKISVKCMRQLHQCFWWPYFVLPSSRWKDSLCSSILYGKLHILLSIKLHCTRYSYAWDSSVRSWKFSSSLYWSGVGERRVGSMGLNMDVSPLVEECDSLSSITHYICYHSQCKLILEVPLRMCRKILVLAKLVVSTNCSRPCLAQASLSHSVWSKWCLQDLTPEYVIWEDMVTYGNMIISVGGGFSGQDGRRIHVVASAQTRI